MLFIRNIVNNSQAAICSLQLGQTLLERGYDVNAKTNDGFTAFQLLLINYDDLAEKVTLELAVKMIVYNREITELSTKEVRGERVRKVEERMKAYREKRARINRIM